MPHQFEPATWRLLITQPASAAWNMALDEAIAIMTAQGVTLPTLRFYQWQPGAVSLGRHQPVADIDKELMQQHGYDLVRRITGGRAILHIDELTYSMAGPARDSRLAGSVMDSYMRLSEGLLLGLQRLGMHAEQVPGDRRSMTSVSAICFQVPSAYEICVGERKLIGSAQSRRAGYVLQHGSLPLQGDVSRLVDVLAVADPQERAQLRQELSSRATTLLDALGRPVTFWEAAMALIDGLTSALEIDLTEGEPDPSELTLAQELLAEKYQSADWIDRV